MTTLIDPVTNPAMVARSSLAVGAHFAVYDANNVVWRRYIATDLGETNILTGDLGHGRRHAGSASRARQRHVR
jgi:hypothetical protein